MGVFHSRASVSFSPRRLGKFYHSSANVFLNGYKARVLFANVSFSLFFLTLCKSSVTFSVVPYALVLWRFWASTAKTKQDRLAYRENFSVSCLF